MAHYQADPAVSLPITLGQTHADGIEGSSTVIPPKLDVTGEDSADYKCDDAITSTLLTSTPVGKVHVRGANGKLLTVFKLSDSEGDGTGSKL